MKMSDDPKLLLEVARLYYEQGFNKTQIAEALNISSTQIGRLLKDAREKGIVEIRYSPPRLEKLGMELVSRFPCLRRAIVVPSIKSSEPASEEDYQFQRRLWGEAAADYFEENVREGTKVGLSGGNTVYEMIAALPNRKREGVEIYPTAIIGRGPTIEHVDPMVLVTLLWAKSGRFSNSAYYVTVPPFENGTTPEEAREQSRLLLTEHAKVRAVHDRMQEVDIVFGSLGSVKVSKEYRAFTHHTTIRLLEQIGIKESRLRESGIVGDINYSFFDESGNPAPAWDFFLTIDARHMRLLADHPKKQVVVIAGWYKLEPLKAALNGRLLNVLITDERTAEKLCI